MSILILVIISIIVGIIPVIAALVWAIYEQIKWSRTASDEHPNCLVYKCKTETKCPDNLGYDKDGKCQTYKGIKSFFNSS